MLTCNNVECPLNAAYQQPCLELQGHCRLVTVTGRLIPTMPDNYYTIPLAKEAYTDAVVSSVETAAEATNCTQLSTLKGVLLETVNNILTQQGTTSALGIYTKKA